MPSDARERIAALRHSHDLLAALVAPLSAGQVSGPSYCSEWTLAEVLSHLGSGAEISQLMLAGALGQGEPAGPDQFQPIWDVWNAKTPEAQAADAIEADERSVAALEQLTDDQLASISLPFFGMELDAAGLVGLRLGEHALHTWDVAVAADPAATVPADAVDLLIDNVASFLAPRLGRAPEQPFAVRLLTSSPARDWLLATDDAVTITPWPGSGLTGTPSVTLPAEALLRLAYGRLDPDHTPAEVTGSDTELAVLRAIFPGF